MLACGEGSYGRLGQGNSDDLHVLTVLSALQGKILIPSEDCNAMTDCLPLMAHGRAAFISQ